MILIQYSNWFDEKYVWDNVSGNLESRVDQINNQTEVFSYDKDRLTEVYYTNGSQPSYLNMNTTYEDNGNISSKLDAGSYSYNFATKFAVEKISRDQGTEIPFFQPQALAYNVEQNPISITEDLFHLTITYGWDKSRREATMTDLTGGVIWQRKYLGNLEIINTQNGDLYHLEYIEGPGGTQFVRIIDQYAGTSENHYIIKDYLGSIRGLVNSTGDLVLEQSFTAWGVKRDPQDWSSVDYYPNPPKFFFRGYTGHEHLDEFGIINMNGRLYDPIVGRMFSRDSEIQNINNTQNHNLYSYVLNNPLRYSDPSGENYGTPYQPSSFSHPLHDATYAMTSGNSPVFGYEFDQQEVDFSNFSRPMIGAYTGGMPFIDAEGAAWEPGDIIPGGLRVVMTSTGADPNRPGCGASCRTENEGPSLSWTRVDSYMAYYGDPARGNLRNMGLNPDGMQFMQGRKTNSFGIGAVQTQSGGSAKVYIETDGIGHVYIEVNGTVFSYHSYTEKKGAAPVGYGVLERHSGEDAQNFIQNRMLQYPTKIHNITGINSNSVYNHLNDAYNSGTPFSYRARIVGTYILLGNNCTSKVCGALKAGGSTIPAFSIPASLNQFLNDLERLENGWNPGALVPWERKF